MLTYIIRRLLYAIPILIGVNLLTFSLFFIVNTPDDMARMHLGEQYVTPQDIAIWKTRHGYDKPLFFNTETTGIKRISDTLFVSKSLRLFIFDFGISDHGRDIGKDIQERMWPSCNKK